MRVLIVDDSNSVHIFVKRLLKCFAGFEPTDAFHGLDALKILKTKTDFDLILLDWEMPVLDGPTTLQEIKKLNLNIPVMMMTSKNQPDEVARMIEMGAAEYIIKPFTIEIITEKIFMITGREAAS